MNTPAKAQMLGGDWAVVVAMSFVFFIGVALGGITTYLITEAVQGPTVVAGPPPAEPVVEAHIIKGNERGKQAPLTRRPSPGTVVITKTGKSYHWQDGAYLALQSATGRTPTGCPTVASFATATIDDMPRQLGSREVGTMMLSLGRFTAGGSDHRRSPGVERRSRLQKKQFPLRIALARQNACSQHLSPIMSVMWP